MAIRVALNHRTHYRFDRPVSLSPHVVRLRPAPHTRTPIESYSLKILPKDHFINWQQDPFGNFQARLVFPEKTRELLVEVDLIADMTVINPFDFFVEDYANEYPFKYEDGLKKELAPYLEVTESGPLLTKWLESLDLKKRNINDFLVDVNQRLEKDINYSIRMEPGIQSCETTLEKALGSCRDSAWLLVQILRHIGLAARFVSGYLVQLKPDVAAIDGPSGPTEDFTDLHAWTEVFLPGAGWVGLDPTSGLFAGEGHIPLACTPHPVSAAPITGATDRCEVEFDFSNSVKRIYEDPRVTKPYRNEQWAAIEALGYQVDEELEAQDVRLTMGGEPTFVSAENMNSAQWDTEALGEEKRELAGQLLKRLYGQFAEGGVLHFGQGKWYPGEPVPRWALNCFWRTDGEPLWQTPELLAVDDKENHFSVEDSETFARNLARTLGVATQHVQAGFEDNLYYLWKEANTPENVSLKDTDLKTEGERKKIAEVLSRGLDKPVGYVIPLRWDWEASRWDSAPWKFRRDRMYLMPGDSPMGLRLPLDSLPWEEKREHFHEQDLFQPLPELGDTYGEVTRRFSHFSAASEPEKEVADAEGEVGENGGVRPVPHTAMCIEVRQGLLHVFMPPITHLEHYLDLLSSVEMVARQLGIPVRLEGYEPPNDWRIKKFAVTPDPGVIEVNIHPARSWKELVENTTILYREAHLTRLGAEKFMLDGRHTGTGGGNHVTIGGPTPADSPVLRRPDLLRSLLTYWQHHPGLSYMFSGMFVGPTSQAPRVDEARNESLYELEIAFQQMPEGEIPEPWLVDRLLRNLLIDVTGNTHRAEFCIDKLYSPSGAAGRQGLLEFRGFEMPPHERMSLVQMLLLRTLVARFWKQPYKHPLVRWGTQLHDRFMLPHFVWEDMKEVVADLQQAGYPFQLEWLAPFLEFRFPHYGMVNIQGIQLDLHWAVEPWHVLGEEVTSMGTSRYVDSSVERLQVKVTGLTDSRYVLVCNGRRVPLRNTGVHGEYVAGVRYRAWQPPSALHPTIGVHVPLVFDLIDTWNGRSIGGCQYHVAHPGGRNYEVYPVNAYEAEGRRISRFWDFGHTTGSVTPPPDLQSLGKFHPEGHPTGPMEPAPEEINREYPYTLDLRRQNKIYF